jgi:rhodanese-related sulfurtransferase
MGRGGSEMEALKNSPKINLISLLSLAGVLLFLFNPCTFAHTNVTVQQARELIDSTSNLIIVDVREPSEYCDDRHIPGALNYPWNSGVLRARYRELSPNYPILFVCRSGGRSNSAANFLDSKGFPMVYDMLGGMSAWTWETTACKYDGGSGTAEDPYQIATAYDIVELGDNPDDYDKHFILTDDIDLDPNLSGRKVFDKALIAPDINPPNWDFQGNPFTGVFDGNGHIILHLTITGESYLGLFGQLGSAAEVKNLGIEHANISGTDCLGSLVAINAGSINACHSTGRVIGNEVVGGLVGDNRGNMTKCYSTGTVTGSRVVGGLTGGNTRDSINEIITITASYSTAVVSGTSYVGGLVGGNGGYYAAKITTCYSTGEVSGDRAVGGLVGKNSLGSDGGEIINCYSTGMVNGNDYVGGLVGINGSLGIINSCFWDIQTSGQTTSDCGVGKTTTEMQDPSTFIAEGWDFVSQPDGPHDIWIEPEGGGYPMLWWQSPSGSVLPDFAGGTGEPNNPYLISTTEQLNAIGHNPKLMDSHFKLTNDLDATDLRFYPIGSPDYPYRGVFDGNDYTISHLTIEAESYLGMFGVIADGAEVKDLGIIDIDITGSDDSIGGLVGLNWGSTVTNCYSTGTVNGGYRYVGGLVGQNINGNIIGSYSAGSITGDYYVGGLVGRNNIGGSITKCYSIGMVTGVNWIVGGLVGTNDGIIIASFSNCTVTGNNDVGGLVGYNNYYSTDCATITNCYSTGMVTGSESVGGLVGSSGLNWQDGTISNCYSTGLVTGKRTVGGFVGYSSSIIISCFWDKETSRKSGSDGGTGKTTTQMQTAGTFIEAGWDFVDETANGTVDIWWIDEGVDYPHLWWEVIE